MPAPLPPGAKKFYYCADGVAVNGPLSADELFEKVGGRDGLPNAIQVCEDGSSDWVAFSTLNKSVFSIQAVDRILRSREKQAREEAERVRQKIQIEKERQQKIENEKMVRIGIPFGLGVIILTALFVWANSNNSGGTGFSTSGATRSPSHAVSAAFEDTFEQAGKVGRNHRYNNRPKPSWDTLNAEAKRRYPGDDERQRAWSAGFATGYDSY